MRSNGLVACLRRGFDDAQGTRATLKCRSNSQPYPANCLSTKSMAAGACLIASKCSSREYSRKQLAIGSTIHEAISSVYQ